MQICSHRAKVLALMLAGLVLAGCGEDSEHTQPQQPAPGRSPTAPAKASEQSPGSTDHTPVVRLPDFTKLVKKVSPAVVNISALPKDSAGKNNGQLGGPLGDWLKHFFHNPPGGGRVPLPRGPGANRHASLGSGFIISSDGYILTNRHVIADAGEIVVKLNDRRQLVAQVVGADRYSDIAVLKIKAKNLPTVAVGNANALPVGAWVVAIGSPFGFETSVTAGIISAKHRSLADDQYVSFLQTDVAINPGNSGGPLFNLAGQVVGINSQIYSQTGGYQGVSFAIPINVAINVARQLRTKGSVTRGWLGVKIQDVDRQLAKSFRLAAPEGALVAQVIADSPAAHAGVKAGDVILAFNGHGVDSAAALPPLVGALAPGDHAKLTVLRDGSQKSIDVTIEALPKNILAGRGQAGAPGEAPPRMPYGLTLKSLSKRARRSLGLDRGGVKIVAVRPGPGARAGLQADDVILAVGAKTVENVPALIGALHAADGPVALLVLRDGVRLYLPMRPDS